MEAKTILQQFATMANPANVQGMARYGITVQNAYGVSMPRLREMAKDIGADHRLARELWATRNHEAHILASLIDDPKLATEAQLERWVRDFDSWDVCDQCCLNLFVHTPWAHQKAVEWSKRKEEFVKRAGFVMIAVLALHDKSAGDAAFMKFLPIIRRESTDERNFVRKAVNWALRGIGKRNLALNAAAVKTAREIQKLDSQCARWVATDALRELSSAAVQKRLKERAR